MALKKLVGKKTEYAGNPSGITSVLIGDKELNTLEPVDLTKKEVEYLEEQGYILTDGSKEELEAIQEARRLSPVVGSDVVASSPVFGNQTKAPKSTKEVS